MNTKYMQIAIELAKKGKGKVYPNPLVGCVIVKEDKIIGKGWHQCFGGKHAEINTLISAGKDAKNADLYVTLEPCNSYGKKPPCTISIIRAGIKRVFYAVKDENVSGSKKILEENGVEVYGGLLEKKAEVLIKDYLKHLKNKTRVSIKAAMSLDGKIATCEYDSKWITSEKSRNLVHKMRSQYDAVLVGANTALRDNPFLTTHSKNLKNPVRVVIDSQLKLPRSHHLFDLSAPTIIIYDEKNTKVSRHLNRDGIILAPVDMMATKKDFNVIVKKLNSFSIKRILIEGGSEIIASALFSKAADDIYFFTAPKIIGGKNAISVVGGPGVKKISESLRVKNVQFKRIGQDFIITGQIDKTAS